MSLGVAQPDLGLPYTAFCGLGIACVSQLQEVDGDTVIKWIFPWAVSGFALHSNCVRSRLPNPTLTIALVRGKNPCLLGSFLFFLLPKTYALKHIV